MSDYHETFVDGEPAYGGPWARIVNGTRLPAVTLHQLYIYCRANGYPAEADRCDHYLQLQGFVSPVGRAAP